MNETPTKQAVPLAKVAIAHLTQRTEVSYASSARIIIALKCINRDSA